MNYEIRVQKLIRAINRKLVCNSVHVSCRRTFYACLNRLQERSRAEMSMNESESRKHDSSLSKFVKDEEMARGKWISLNKITYTDPRNNERVWECVKRTTRTAGSADAVGIIAILKRLLHFDCLVLVKQYRPPMKCYTLEFPAGLVDASESPETAALREMKEETGYTATIKHVSPVTCLDPGIGNTTVQLVTVEIDGDEACNKNPKQSTEESEFIEVVLIPVDELLDKLDEYAKSGVSVDSRVYSYALGLHATKDFVKMDTSQVPK